MKAVSPKKKLGQHFLNDLNIAQKIADLLHHQGCDHILEIGPGMGVLTQFLIPRAKNLKLVEIDNESVAYLSRKYPERQRDILNEDFLKMNLSKPFEGQAFGIIGNFPYNISSQIVFKARCNSSQAKNNSYYTLFFYKNTVYKGHQPQIYPKNKNILTI